MQQIHPYQNSSEAMSILDNGGRFYNLLTKQGDGEISTAEIAKVAGIFNDRQKVVLFLEMALSKLEPGKKEGILAKLGEDAGKAYKTFKPQELLPSEAQQKGTLAANAIVFGIPKFVDSKSQLNGFIMIPITTGKVIIPMMVPIIDKYDVYEITDELSSETFLIAHTRGEKKLPGHKIKVGGVIKELKADPKEKIASGKFIEALYFMD